MPGIASPLATFVHLLSRLVPRKIRVNFLDPGMIETEGLRAAGRDSGTFREHQEKEPRLAGSLQGDTPLLKVSTEIKLGV